ncbi:MAG TPA: iron-sulfur cluster repair di-iron protein [Candidatus Hydrogenedentes bacterium]|nr:iron-sulfur cluster repair di-iron protein [Candidatus Hydrogenedentota bacterium]HPJ99632.1 iron-sulfur cluster repair di-iron protein [Candidatus Hydrogenedentota bacterium]
MTTAINPEATVGQLVTENPALSRVFESFGLDYCCGGGKTLTEACSSRGVDLQTVRQELARVGASADESQPNPADMTLTELADHIEQTHHAYLREVMPVLQTMSAKVANAHAKRDPRYNDVQRVVGELAQELESHSVKEERILFPAIRRLDAGQSLQGFTCGALENPIHVMEMEHDDMGRALAELRTLTDGYAVPDWACNTCRGMLTELERLEKDLHQHIHKENNILFPRTLEREAAITG